MQPEISINICTKDRASLLDIALESIARQTFTDYEIILVDDGSADDTRGVIGAFQKKYPQTRMTVIQHKLPQGVGSSRQAALQASTAKYIAVLDDDDWWIDPDKLKKQLDYLDTHPEVGIVGGNVEIVDIDNNRTKISNLALSDSSIRSAILYKAPFVNSATMFRRSVALTAGGFEGSHQFSEDYLFWLKIGRVGKFGNLPNIFTHYTSHSDGLTRKNAAAILQLALQFALQFRRDYPGFLRALLKLVPQYLFVRVFGIKSWYKLKNLYA